MSDRPEQSPSGRNSTENATVGTILGCCVAHAGVHARGWIRSPHTQPLSPVYPEEWHPCLVASPHGGGCNLHQKARTAGARTIRLILARCSVKGPFLTFPAGIVCPPQLTQLRIEAYAGIAMTSVLSGDQSLTSDAWPVAVDFPSELQATESMSPLNPSDTTISDCPSPTSVNCLIRSVVSLGRGETQPIRRKTDAVVAAVRVSHETLQDLILIQQLDAAPEL